MKILSVLLLLFVSGYFSILRAQSQTQLQLSDADRVIVQSWSEADQVSEVRIDRDGVLLPGDDRDATCAFLRVYRMKRESPGSDVTRPNGYTACVMSTRFQMKSSKKPNRAPQQ
jgi:hypothetical protein